MDIVIREDKLISVVGKDLRKERIVGKVRVEVDFIGGLKEISETDVYHGSLDRVYKTFVASMVTVVEP